MKGHKSDSSLGDVLLIPSPLSSSSLDLTLSSKAQDCVRQLRHFAVENARSARRYLSALKMSVPIDQLEIRLLNKGTPSKELEEILQPVMQGYDLGVISEAGCPGVADPGANLVALAHHLRIRVRPMVGPSSILMALMGSGLNGQSFAFVGYLPIEPKARMARIRELERRSRVERQTQLLIETPYRNDKLLEAMLNVLHEETLLTIAIDLTGNEESLETRRVREWITDKPLIGKRPTVFALLA